VHVEYHRNIKKLVISDISQEGFPEVDMEKFRSILRKHGIEPGMRFLKYNFRELTEKITDALGEAYSKELMREDDDRPVWFIIRPAGYGEVKLIISSALPKCEPAT